MRVTSSVRTFPFSGVRNSDLTVSNAESRSPLPDWFPVRSSARRNLRKVRDAQRQTERSSETDQCLRAPAVVVPLSQA